MMDPVISRLSNIGAKGGALAMLAAFAAFAVSRDPIALAGVPDPDQRGAAAVPDRRAVDQRDDAAAAGPRAAGASLELSATSAGRAKTRPA